MQLEGGGEYPSTILEPKQKEAPLSFYSRRFRRGRGGEREVQSHHRKKGGNSRAFTYRASQVDKKKMDGSPMRK